MSMLISGTLAHKTHVKVTIHTPSFDLNTNSSSPFLQPCTKLKI